MNRYSKWNYDTHKYDEYLVPSECNLKTYSNNMNEIINCAQCLKELTVAESYTSLEVHDSLGFGYGICDKCYEEEWNRRAGNYDD